MGGKAKAARERAMARARAMAKAKVRARVIDTRALIEVRLEGRVPAWSCNGDAAGRSSLHWLPRQHKSLICGANEYGTWLHSSSCWSACVARGLMAGKLLPLIATSATVVS